MADSGRRPDGFLGFLQKSRDRAMSSKSDARLVSCIQAADETRRSRSPASESILPTDTVPSPEQSCRSPASAESIISSETELAVEEVLSRGREVATRLRALSVRAKGFVTAHPWEADALRPALEAADALVARTSAILSRAMFGAPFHRLPMYTWEEVAAAESSLSAALCGARRRVRGSIID